MDTLTEPRVFYSKSANFSCVIKPARQVMLDGAVKQIDSKIVEFQPQGDGYGRYITYDPEEIAVLETKYQVINAHQYQELSIPAEQRLQIERQDKVRTITENNRLMQDLNEKERKNQELLQRIKDLESQQGQTPSPAKK
jgi:hypothetical protein